MRRRGPLRAGLAALGLLLCAPGCAGTGVEQEAELVTVQAYPFAIVWESLIEAVAESGFAIGETERGADGGVFETRFRLELREPSSRPEEGRRVRGRVRALGDDRFRVFLAASHFERIDAHNPWRYIGADDALTAAIRDRYEAAKRRRYQDGE